MDSLLPAPSSPPPRTVPVSATRPVLQRTTVWLLAILVALSVTAALYIASDIMIPLTAALLLAAALRPLQRALADRHMPSPLGATLIVGLVAGLLALAIAGLATPASNWIEKAPEIAAEAKLKLHQIVAPVADVKRASRKVEEIANVGDGDDDKNKQVVVKDGGSVLGRIAESVQHAGAQLVVMIVALWFLLAAGPSLTEGVKRSPAELRIRRRIDVATKRVTRDISRYLLTILCINIALGLAVALALWISGMPNPFLWGALAMLLNFVPYAGAAVGVGIVFVVALMSFETLPQAVVPAVFYAGLSILEGQWLTPLILGRRLALNPLMIFLFVLFWGWLWGVPGALMAVPIMVSLRTVCAYALPDSFVARTIIRNGH